MGRPGSLEIIPVFNKIDLPSAQPEEARRQIDNIIGLDGTGGMATTRSSWVSRAL